MLNILQNLFQWIADVHYQRPGDGHVLGRQRRDWRGARAGRTDFGIESAGRTIRGDLALSGQNNLIHASDSPESSERELALWFKAGELLPVGKGSGSALRDWVYSAEERK